MADRVVIKKVEAEEKTASGIVLPGSAKEQPQIAEVVEVGPGGIVDGKEIQMELKVGDKVIFSKFAGTEIKLEGQEYIILKQNEVLAVVE
ncbi:10 kDa chaperonin [[Clostridium] sordellii ATCC 9714]|nr:10 kDa chaperonin [[Clostridium] sordellii ATCC 9714] [Paeniclostridium sordellii ATCC 9714]